MRLRKLSFSLNHIDVTIEVQDSVICFTTDCGTIDEVFPVNSVNSLYRVICALHKLAGVVHYNPQKFMAPILSILALGEEYKEDKKKEARQKLWV